MGNKEIDPFDGAKQAPLRVNPEQASRIHAGGVEGLTWGLNAGSNPS